MASLTAHPERLYVGSLVSLLLHQLKLIMSGIKIKQTKKHLLALLAPRDAAHILSAKLRKHHCFMTSSPWDRSAAPADC